MKRSIRLVLHAVAAAVMLMPAAAQAAGRPAQSLEERRKQLDSLLKEQWEYTLRTAPEFASILGDKRYNDKVSDISEKAVLADLEMARKFLARFEAVDTTGFPVQEQLNKTLMVRQLKESLDGAKFENWLMPVDQFNGIHILIPQLISILQFDTVKDYEDYIARMKQYPAVLDEAIALMKKGASKHLVPPRILLEKVVVQAQGIGQQKPEDSPFAQPVKKFPAGISEVDQKRLTAELIAAIRDGMNPAYMRFTAYVRDEYVPQGRKDPGMWALPDGAARYAFQVKSNTTTTMTPEEIHQLGLKEVARIEAETQRVATKLGFKDLPSLYASIAKNPDLHPKSRQEILDLYRKYIDQMYGKLPDLFGRLPKGKVEVMAVEEFREKDASGAQYAPGTPDGSRPGHVMVNTGDYQNRTTTTIETTAYHEGVPGHHLQGTIAQELPELPPFRQQGGYTAYVEGWALYSERLGEEVGFFQNPYSYYGHLQDEMLRAIRLVVDTGFHYKRWTRQQVVDFFHTHSGIDEVEVQAETDRYIAVPGQALGYKIGQLKILGLREKAKAALGPKFDVRGFHDTVLGAGALPMDVLEQQVDAWVAAQKPAK